MIIRDIICEIKMSACKYEDVMKICSDQNRVRMGDRVYRKLQKRKQFSNDNGDKCLKMEECKQNFILNDIFPH